MANYNLFDAASLAMVPTGIKDGKLYSVKPNDGAGDFTFSRGSNLTATRVNADGLIEKGRENLLVQSNQFNTTWTLSNASVTSGQNGYDGSSDAWLLNATTSASESYTRQTTSLTGVGTFSIYAKAGTANFIAIYIASTGADIYGWFNLSTGAIGSGAGQIDKNITSVGGGWYRIDLTGLNPDQRVDVYVANANGSFLTNSGDNIYIQDAQLEQGLVATDYIETTTAPVSAGITENLPRIDYSSGCGSLLLEPQRVNLISHSEYFGAWSDALGCDIFTNTTTSPEGVENAATISFGSNADSRAFVAASNSSATYIFSVYAKSSTSKKFRFRISGSSGTLYSNDLTTTSEWQRFDYEYTGDITAIGITNASTADVGSINVYGFQAEQGSYPTSYIPTYGSAATRTVEKVDGQENASAYNDSEGVLFVEFSAFADSGRDNEWRFLISDGTNNNRIQIGLPNATNNLYASCIASGVTSVDMTHTLNNASSNHKVAIKYKANDFAMYVDGVEVDTDTSGSVPTGLDIFDFYRTPNNNNYVEANVKQVLYFKTALTNNELAALTRPYDTYQEWVDGEGLTWESKSCTVQNIVELQNL